MFGLMIGLLTGGIAGWLAGKIMNNEKVNYLIDIIKDMDIENKLRFAICMCDNYRQKLRD